jgi:hypothetical protein
MGRRGDGAMGRRNSDATITDNLLDPIKVKAAKSN